MKTLLPRFTKLSDYGRKVSDEIARLYLMKIRRDCRGGYGCLHCMLFDRWNEMEAINELSQDIRYDIHGGEIPMWISGMDCDCNSYANAELIKVSDWWDYQEFLEARQRGLDGPEYYRFLSWDEYEACKDEHYSRDLVAEATEDGHPWVVYS